MVKNSFYFIIWVVCVHANPNFVFFLTDDQDLLLNGMIALNKTKELIAKEGKTFNNAFANTPICCPSRSAILTGKYVHNTGVVNNSIAGNCSSSNWQNYHEPNTIAAILKNEKNYSTFYAGKYLNMYGYEEAGGIEHVPKGYDWWIGLQGNSKYYNYSLSVNGTERPHGDGNNDYLTDVLANYSLSFLDNRPRDKPFFMTVATPAAHAPFTPAPRHQNFFSGTKAIRTPNFNYSANDKHWLVSMLPKYLPENVTILDTVQQNRQETLLAVDELVEAIITKLKEQNILDVTYIIVTSDHGFHIGQFTQPWDKREPYETDIRIPFMIRGPNITHLTDENYPMLTVDIAPTILDLANVTIPTDIDGESLKEIILQEKHLDFDKDVLIEYWGEHDTNRVDVSCPWKYDDNLTECQPNQWCKCEDSKNNTYSCFVNISKKQQYKFCQFDDDVHFVEAYNITADPYELINLANRLDEDVLQNYRNKLTTLKKCSGRSCWAGSVQMSRDAEYRIEMI